jgi:hypothetical protein
MIFGIQMYHEEMQVKFEYRCDPIIVEGVITLELRKLLENDSFRAAMKWPGAYSVTLRHSIIPSFHKLVSVRYLMNGCTHLIQIWYMDTS